MRILKSLSIIPIILLLLISLLPTSSSTEFKYEKDTNILILTQLDFPSAISQHKYLLVNFYARWCRYSKKLAPEYLKLSESLKESDSEVKIAKVEAYDEKDLAKEYDIEGFPTIKLFINGVAYAYHGSRNAANILQYVQRMQKKPLSKISDVNSIEKSLKEYEWIGILIGKDNEPAVLDAAFKLQDVLFVSTSAQELKTKYGNLQDGEFVLVNNITKGHEVFTETLTADNLVAFIKKNRFSNVPRFGKGTAEHIMASEEPAMILIRDSSQASQKAEEALIQASDELSGKIFLSVANYDEEIGQLLAKQFDLKKEDLPAVRILRADREKIRKYYLEGGITQASLIKFYEDYSKRKAPRVYLSEPVPKENKDLTLKVVLDTFKEEVLDAKKDVLVIFWAPWSSHCRAVSS